MTISSGMSSPLSMSFWAGAPSSVLDFTRPAACPRGDMRHDIVMREANALRSLAGPLLAEDHEPDPGDHRSPT